MPHQKMHSRIQYVRWLVIVSAAVVGLFILRNGSVAAQAPDKSVSDEAPTDVTFHIWKQSNAPIKIVHIMVGNKEIAPDTPVTVEGEWIGRIGIVVENISPKTIVECSITLVFPETAVGMNNNSSLAVPMNLGRYPKHAFIQRDGTDRSLTGRPQPPENNIPPGALMTFMVGQATDTGQAQAYKLAGGHISKITIELDPVYFSDESKWMSGSYYIAVPPPIVWQQITPAEFAASSQVQDKQ